MRRIVCDAVVFVNEWQLLCAAFITVREFYRQINTLVSNKLLFNVVLVLIIVI